MHAYLHTYKHACMHSHMSTACIPGCTITVCYWLQYATEHSMLQIPACLIWCSKTCCVIRCFNLLYIYTYIYIHIRKVSQDKTNLNKKIKFRTELENPFTLASGLEDWSSIVLRWTWESSDPAVSVQRLVLHCLFCRTWESSLRTQTHTHTV